MRPLLHASLALILAGCATGSAGTAGTLGTSSGAGGATGSGGAAVGGGHDAGTGPMEIPCSPGMPCDPGKTCLNGVCASGCNSDADCTSTQYCALSSGQVCVDKTLVACPATACAPTQVCVAGLCATVPTGMPCGPSLFGGDGCMMDALCLGNVVVDGVLKPDAVCYVLPSCSTSHPCSTGGAGALCSAGFIMGKDDVCIPGACATDASCPASWKCVPGAMMSGYGECSNGAAGQPCGSMADCKPGLQCHVPVVDQLGTCK